MANIKKHDYAKLCKDRGLTYISEQNPHIFIKDVLGFTHKFERSCFVRGSKPSLKSVIGDKTEYSKALIANRHVGIEALCDFNKYRFVTALSYTTVTCKKHGDYQTKHNWLLSRGHHCMKCAEEDRPKHKNLGTTEFIKRSKEKFGDMYSYDKTVYKDCRNPVTITCKTHGDFEVIAYCHSNGEQGCQMCGHDREKVTYSKKQTNGSFVYVMAIETREKVLYKIGLSAKPTRRLSTIRKESGYNVKLLHTEFFKDSGQAWDVESMLLEEFKDKQASCEKTFKGHTECFQLTSELEIVKLLKCFA